MSDKPDVSFLSQQVTEAQYYYLDLQASWELPLTVVCGGREQCDADYHIDRPGFQYYSIEFIAAGQGNLRMGEKNYKLRPGTVFHYGPGVPHRITVEPGDLMVKYFVDFVGSESEALLGDGPLLYPKPSRVAEPSRIHDLYNELSRAGNRQSQRAAQMCELTLRLLILQLADDAVPYENMNSISWSTYRKCRTFIERNFLSLDQLSAIAAECHVSENYLCRLFQEYDQQTPYQFLSRLKMAHAASLLTNRELLVKEVAERVGYDDPYHFSKSFKRVYGLSPGVFRSQGR